jgi:hypothetical protein
MSIDARQTDELLCVAVVSTARSLLDYQPVGTRPRPVLSTARLVLVRSARRLSCRSSSQMNSVSSTSSAFLQSNANKQNISRRSMRDASVRCRSMSCCVSSMARASACDNAITANMFIDHRVLSSASSARNVNGRFSLVQSLVR